MVVTEIHIQDVIWFCLSQNLIQYERDFDSPGPVTKDISFLQPSACRYLSYFSNIT
jgi:hypothetical protein